MANAVVALGGVIGLAITVPVLLSLVPPPEAEGSAWSGLTPDEVATLKKATDIPIKVTFELHETDGYFPAGEEEQFVWAVKTTEEQMKQARPALFGGVETVPYPVVNMGFAIFSPICPHLGCRYAWAPELNKFACPCHGSQYTNLGAHTAGPALRGLDPLPLRDFQGQVQIEWIEYKQGTPDHIILRIA
jgi:Rieske Fe-S protein